MFEDTLLNAVSIAVMLSAAVWAVVEGIKRKFFYDAKARDKYLPLVAGIVSAVFVGSAWVVGGDFTLESGVAHLLGIVFILSGAEALHSFRKKF